VHTQVQFAVTHVCVSAKCILKCACEVRVFRSFLGVRSAIALLHTFCSKMGRICYFLTFFHIFNTQGCSKTGKDALKQNRMCGCKVRPPKNRSLHTCACALISGHARCVRATQKTIATHPLTVKCHR
jgi:hypothetical protein